MGSHPLVRDLRGVGFFIGLELVSEEAAFRCLQACYERGLLIGIGGMGKNVLRLEPPLTFSDDDCATTTRILLEALNSQPVVP